MSVFNSVKSLVNRKEHYYITAIEAERRRKDNPNKQLLEMQFHIC